MNILDCVPDGFKLREAQVYVLQKIPEMIDTKGVIVIEGDVGIGKSLIAKTIANWLEHRNISTAIITPRIDLMEQYTDTYKDLPDLKGANRYQCKDLPEYSCGEVSSVRRTKCKGCPHVAAKVAVDQSSQALYNHLSYNYRLLSNRNSMPKDRVSGASKDVIIIDEAHGLYSRFVDTLSQKVWKHKEHYPNNINTIVDVIVWLESQVKKLKAPISRLFADRHKDEEDQEELTRLLDKQKKYENIARYAAQAPDNFFFEKTKLYHINRNRDLLYITPTTLKGLPPMLWDNKTKCKILMSGTISSIDLDHLGLSHENIGWITAPPVMAPEQRPIIVDRGVNMSYKYQDQNIPKLADLLLDLAEENPGKGFVHCTYTVAEKLKTLLSKNNRFMFHEPSTRSEQLDKFKGSKDSILIACGMDEGIDLAGDEFKWQAICKIQFPSMAEPVYKFWYSSDKRRINWMTAKWLQQACGRICRGPNDYGKTYILDLSIGNPVKKKFGFYKSAEGMLPEHFKKRFKWT